MVLRMVGLVCAAFSVALMVWALLGDGESFSLLLLGLSLLMLLIAVLTLRPGHAHV